MVLAQPIRAARSLPEADRLTLMSELWDSFDPDGIPVSDAEVRLVQERARWLDVHPEDEMGWDAFEALVDARLA